jgi:hypothetical protein
VGSKRARQKPRGDDSRCVQDGKVESVGKVGYIAKKIESQEVGRQHK